MPVICLTTTLSLQQNYVLPSHSPRLQVELILGYNTNDPYLEDTRPGCKLSSCRRHNPCLRRQAQGCYKSLSGFRHHRFWSRPQKRNIRRSLEGVCGSVYSDILTFRGKFSSPMQNLQLYRAQVKCSTRWDQGKCYNIQSDNTLKHVRYATR